MQVIQFSRIGANEDRKLVFTYYSLLNVVLIGVNASKKFFIKHVLVK